jgi:3-(3-hydroxy-phenyl)propionate hydroxylase
VLDVAVIGLGPVGQTLVALLRREGLEVEGFDAAPGPHGSPRAAALDDEVLRILQGIGVSPPGLIRSPSIWLSGADGVERRVFSPVREPYGHPPLAFFHQPGLEEALLRAAGDVTWGAALGALREVPGGVELDVGVRARWVVACDGARSTVRRLLGVPFTGSTFAQRWYVVDTEVAEERPARMVFGGDPRRPWVSLPLSPRHHRHEFMLGAGEHSLPLSVPGQVVRAVPYTYHARMAASWRRGRVLLAGDAAHVMPPFAGQGLSAGLRDGANLAWKLGEVVRGESPAALLDTYEPERRPGVAAHTRLAVAWGRAVSLRRPRAASSRDRLIDGAIAIPWLADWARGGAIRPSPRLPAGERLLPQPLIDGVPLDDLLGPGWADIGPGHAAWEALRDWSRGRAIRVRPDRYASVR